MIADVVSHKCKHNESQEKKKKYLFAFDSGTHNPFMYSRMVLMDGNQMWTEPFNKTHFSWFSFLSAIMLQANVVQMNEYQTECAMHIAWS